MKSFKDLKQPTDKTKKLLRLIAGVVVPTDIEPDILMDRFIEFCDKNGWVCQGGGVQFPDNDPLNI